VLCRNSVHTSDVNATLESSRIVVAGVNWVSSDHLNPIRTLRLVVKEWLKRSDV